MSGSRARARRRVDLLLVAVGGLLVAVVTAGFAAAGDGERVTGMWAGAEVAADGGATVVEVIDYDFGPQAKHGIFRDVPGLRADDPGAVRVSSGTAPADVQLSPSGGGTRIRVGDPNRTVTGRHRYRIEYPLGGVAPGGVLAWDAVGTGWTVPIGAVEVHVAAPFEFRDVRCVRGGVSAEDPCASAAQAEPGRLDATESGLDPGEGVTVYATGTPIGAAPSLPEPPAGAPVDPGTGVLPPALLAVVAALAAAALTSRVVRRAGRERVAAGGAAEAAWAEPGREMLVDPVALGDLATIEFAPPRELTAPQGGVLLAEAVRGEHQAAWLIGAAIDGYLDLEQGGRSRNVTLVRRPHTDGPATVLIDRIFDGRNRVILGTYDASFAEGWRGIGAELRDWQRGSGLWDPAGDRRRLVALVCGSLAGLVGFALAGLGGVLANRQGAAFLALVAVGALGAGAGIAAVVRAWELRVRTPTGSGLWLRVESFRRFLAGSEAHHADEAAKRGVLREYTAWAVAVGEIDRWSRAVAASSVAADPAAAATVSYAMLGPSLSRAAASSAVEPSSSGGGGGGVGGGAGGGGGGSW